jgi:hypothetical protein
MKQSMKCARKYQMNVNAKKESEILMWEEREENSAGKPDTCNTVLQIKQHRRNEVDGVTDLD